MSNTRSPTDITPSICEEALDLFSKSDDSLAGLIEQNHIEVRDFMILSFVCDQGEMGVDQLIGALGLSHQTIQDRIERLLNAGFVRHNAMQGQLKPESTICATAQGRTIVQRILGQLLQGERDRTEE